MLKFDYAGRELARYEVPVELSGLVVADLTGKGGLKLFTGESRGNLHVLDADLRPLRQIRVTPNSRDWVSLKAELAADLDDDGRPELVLQSVRVEFVSGTRLGPAQRRGQLPALPRPYPPPLRRPPETPGQPPADLETPYPHTTKDCHALLNSNQTLVRGAAASSHLQRGARCAPASRLPNQASCRAPRRDRWPQFRPFNNKPKLYYEMLESPLCGTVCVWCGTGRSSRSFGWIGRRVVCQPEHGH